jgi:hypothetical protein
MLSDAQSVSGWRGVCEMLVKAPQRGYGGAALSGQSCHCRRCRRCHRCCRFRLRWHHLLGQCRHPHRVDVVVFVVVVVVVIADVVINVAVFVVIVAIVVIVLVVVVVVTIVIAVVATMAAAVVVLLLSSSSLKSSSLQRRCRLKADYRVRRRNTYSHRFFP